jgi:2-keto-4-pentenoate hydratase/2-oxohepta-3-ene-1,7-dioic acid hydratase in catechol pathway
MRFVVFGDDRRVGAWVGDQIVDLNRADPSIPAGLEAFISAGPSALEAAQHVIERASSAPAGVTLPVSTVALQAPWPERRIACVGGNYAAHLRGMEQGRPGAEGATLEEVTQRTRAAGQWGFWKVPFEVAGPEDEIPFPKRATYFDYEGEAAIVIGKRGKDIPADKIGDYVWGVTLVNDWSVRDGMSGPQRPMSYNLPKNFDRSTSMGPAIVVGELEPQNVDVVLSINGQERQRYNTKDMVFSFAEVLAELSRDFTFVPGDVISGGTSEGTAQDKSKRGLDGTRPLDLFLKAGDVVELSSPAIGMLRNRIVSA